MLGPIWAQNSGACRSGWVKLSLCRLHADRDSQCANHGLSGLCASIADGEAKPGERLPPAKDLAAILGVNIRGAGTGSDLVRRGLR